MNFAIYQAGLFLLGRPESIRQSTLLMTLATGMDDPDALINGLSTISNTSKAHWAGRIDALSEGLQQGLSLGAVLANDPKLLPATTMTAIRVAEEMGGLRQVLADEASRISQLQNGSPGALLNILGPILIAGFVSMSILTFIMIFIIPKFKKIFEDFDTQLPAATIRLIDFSDWMINYWFLFVPFILVTSLYYLIWQHRWVSRRAIPLEGFFYRLWAHHILRWLGHAIAANGDLNAALNQIRSGLPDGRVARSLSTAQARFANGEDLWHALLLQGFLSHRDVAYLESARKSGHADWGLLYLAEARATKQRRWLHTVSQLLPVILLLSIGFLVMFISVGLFLPLLKLLNELA